MFGGLLHRLCQERVLSIEQIAAAWKIEPASVYPYFGDRWPTVDRLMALLERVPPEAQKELVNFVLRSAPRWVATRIDPARDINGDGQVDTRDVIAAAIESAEDAMGMVKATHQAVGDRQLTTVEIDELLQHRDEAMANLIAYGELLVYLRRHARPERRKIGAALTATGRA